MSTDVLNFSAGPAMLPHSVIERLRDTLDEWDGKSASVIEISHRDKSFIEVVERAEASLKRILGMDDEWQVLFLGGGATGQFAGVPLNLLQPGRSAGYIDTGQWGGKAIQEARKFGDIVVTASAKDDGYAKLPDLALVDIDPNWAYLHFCANETVDGTQYGTIAQTAHSVPLVADCSSELLTRVMPLDRFAAFYGGAQKNVGPAGVTIVCVRKELLGSPQAICPAVWDWTQQGANDSALNTPPVYAILASGFVFEWVEEHGGVPAAAARAAEKSTLLYETIDRIPFYSNDRATRSKTNIVFRLTTEELEKQFLKEAEANGMIGLKGHRAVGGCRASVYLAMPMEGVQTLVAFMEDFAQRNG